MAILKIQSNTIFYEHLFFVLPLVKQLLCLGKLTPFHIRKVQSSFYFGQIVEFLPVWK